jgi:regulator of protease activity HflC (stomatin/prohibitin superfamily)
LRAHLLEAQADVEAQGAVVAGASVDLARDALGAATGEALEILVEALAQSAVARALGDDDAIDVHEVVVVGLEPADVLAGVALHVGRERGGGSRAARRPRRPP